LKPVPEEKGRSAASFRAKRNQKKVEESWRSSSPFAEDVRRAQIDRSMDKNYAEWLGKDAGKRRGDQGLFEQTILEEDDDSDY